MARKKIKIAMLVDERRRSSVFQQRLKMLHKKAEELSTLCGIKIGIIVFSPDQENDEFVWPSRDEFKQILTMFLDKPLVERYNKLITHEKHLKKEIDAKVEKKTVENEMEHLLKQLYLGEKTEFELDKKQIRGVRKMIAKMREEVDERRKQLDVQDQRLQLSVDDPLALRLAPPGCQ